MNGPGDASVVAPILFRKASVLCYRIFDVAQEIDLERAHQLLAEGTRRLRLRRAGSEYVQLPNPPLSMELGPRALTLRDGTVTVQASARFFDHGAVTILLAVPVPPGCEVEPLISLADELYDSVEVEHVALDLVNGLRAQIASASQEPKLWNQNESYTIVFAEKIEGAQTAAEILRGAEIARLLLGEVKSQSLSERERTDVTQHAFSYTDLDLAVVDWNSAFVWEPTGSQDIPDILEICNAQLLEMRFYDALLEHELSSVYDEIQKKRRSWFSLFRSPYRLLTRRVLGTWMEMSEFIERVENSLKIIGDFYLAKVYEAGVRRLRIASWKESVTRKHETLANVYQLLKGEVETDRSLWLDITITFLIVIELAVAVLSVVRGSPS